MIENMDAIAKGLPIKVKAELAAVCEKYGIKTTIQLCHFLAQCSHESQGFTMTEENLNYSLDALLRIFPKYFNVSNVEKYPRKKVLIGSRVYANRMGNGSEESREGWFYRGRGYIQLTGKDNYAKFSVVVGEDLVLNPDLVATKYPLESAAWFWDTHKLSDIAERGPDQQVVADITKVINGGFNGLEDRQRRFDLFWAAAQS